MFGNKTKVEPEYTPLELALIESAKEEGRWTRLPLYSINAQYFDTKTGSIATFFDGNTDSTCYVDDVKVCELFKTTLIETNKIASKRVKDEENIKMLAKLEKKYL